jgi:formylglycine-generating enzyme required for sulfatase activity
VVTVRKETITIFFEVRKMRRVKLAICLVVVCVMGVADIASADTFGSGANQFTIDFVPISGSTNPTSGYGIVANDYRMGTYEITNAQWTKFKTAYGEVLGTPAAAYRYDSSWTGENVPTNEVSWYEAAQFVNYLNTSTGHAAAYKFTGTIHTSSYTLDIWGAGDADETNLYRNKNAKYFLPTENEWVKAAYWNGTSLQTYSNVSTGDLVGGLPDPAKWNYSPSVGSEPWNVGSGSQELNGTFDMMGNVLEWMESPYYAGNYWSDSDRGLRGGSYRSFNYGDVFALASWNRGAIFPDYDYQDIGFRVASIPEPATLLMLGVGGLVLRKRK